MSLLYTHSGYLMLLHPKVDEMLHIVAAVDADA